MSNHKSSPLGFIGTIAVTVFSGGLLAAGAHAADTNTGPAARQLVKPSAPVGAATALPVQNGVHAATAALPPTITSVTLDEDHVAPGAGVHFTVNGTGRNTGCQVMVHIDPLPADEFQSDMPQPLYGFPNKIWISAPNQPGAYGVMIWPVGPSKPNPYQGLQPGPAQPASPQVPGCLMTHTAQNPLNVTFHVKY